MRVFISGATGFVGFPIAQELITAGHEVLALSRSDNQKRYATGVDWLVADLSEPSTYQESLLSFAPEVVVHLSWQDIPNFSFQKSLNNLNQSINLLSFVTEIESCRKVLVGGSCFETAKTNGVCLESDVGTPTNHFTWAKLSIRSWLEVICAEKNISFGWMRIFYVYGPRQRSGSLIPTILNRLQKATLPAIRTPKNSNDFIFIDDVVKAFVAAVKSDFPNGIFNIGSGVSTPVSTICRIAEHIVCNSDVLISQLEQETRSVNSSCDFWADTTRARKYLDWQSQVSLEEGIKRTWEHLKAE